MYVSAQGKATRDAIMRVFMDRMAYGMMPPTIREIMPRVGLRSTSAVLAQLRNMVVEGRLVAVNGSDRRKNESRPYRVNPELLRQMRRIVAELASDTVRDAMPCGTIAVEQYHDHVIFVLDDRDG